MQLQAQAGGEERCHPHTQARCRCGEADALRRAGGLRCGGLCVPRAQVGHEPDQGRRGDAQAGQPRDQGRGQVGLCGGQGPRGAGPLTGVQAGWLGEGGVPGARKGRDHGGTPDRKGHPPDAQLSGRSIGGRRGDGHRDGWKDKQRHEAGIACACADIPHSCHHQQGQEGCARKDRGEGWQEAPAVAEGQQADRKGHHREDGQDAESRQK
mmetsp:Transcript_33336/g.85471  ORF Transcript_33336/g.85471 Transcript_33336/m.85471 type:complete len:210 (+) Transcript_33336:103-732(+)